MRLVPLAIAYIVGNDVEEVPLFKREFLWCSSSVALECSNDFLGRLDGAERFREGG